MNCATVGRYRAAILAMLMGATAACGDSGETSEPDAAPQPTAWTRGIEGAQLGVAAINDAGISVISGEIAANATADFGGGGRSAGWFVAAFDADGNYLWDDVRSADHAEDRPLVAIDDAGNVLVALIRRPFGAESIWTELVAFDATGEWTWTKNLTGLRSAALRMQGDGVFAVTGWPAAGVTAVDFGDGDVPCPGTGISVCHYVATFEADGSLRWVATLPTVVDELTIAADEVIVSGALEVEITTALGTLTPTGGDPEGGGDGDAVVFAYDTAGALAWQTSWGLAEEFDWAAAVVNRPGGGAYVVELPALGSGLPWVGHLVAVAVSGAVDWSVDPTGVIDCNDEPPYACEDFRALSVAPNGDVLLGGGYQAATLGGTEYTSPGCFVARYGTGGAESWALAMPTTATFCWVGAVREGTDGGIYAVASFTEEVSVPGGTLASEGMGTALLRIEPE